MHNKLGFPAAVILFLFLCTALYQAAKRAEGRAADKPSDKSLTTGELKGEIARLETLLPDQSHAMSDVGYHFANAWFAAQTENWPLTKFYVDETVSHLHWAVRIKPIRQDSAGKTIELEKILEALENSTLKDLCAAVDSRDKTKFSALYRTTLEGCYSCHKAADKPYLRPQVPTSGESRIINPDPNATFPR